MKRAILYMLCLGCVILIIAIIDGRSRNRIEDASHRQELEMQTKPELRIFDEEELFANVVACSNAVETLGKGHIDEFVDRMSVIRMSVRSLNNEQLAKVMRPLNDFVFSECSRDNANLDFADVASFVRYEEILCAAVIQLGEVRLVGGPVPGDVVRLYEPLVLTRFRMCLDKARSESRDDVVIVVKQAYDKWVKGIESKNGLTRRYMQAVFEFEADKFRPLSVSIGWNLVKGVRSAVFELLMEGVLPKWIDDDFGYDRLLDGLENTGVDSGWGPAAWMDSTLKDVSEASLRSLPHGSIESSADYSAYVMRLREMVLRKGESFLIGESASRYEACRLEAGYFELMWQYRVLFTAQGRKDCADLAKEELLNWKKFASSDSGLTRRWADSMIQTVNATRDSNNRLREVRLQIYNLVLSGCTPSWACDVLRR